MSRKSGEGSYKGRPLRQLGLPAVGMGLGAVLVVANASELHLSQLKHTSGSLHLLLSDCNSVGRTLPFCGWPTPSGERYSIPESVHNTQAALQLKLPS